MKTRLPRPTADGYVLIGATAILLMLGLVMVYSVTGVYAITRGYAPFLSSLRSGEVTADRVPDVDTMAFFARQLRYALAGLVGAWMASVIPWDRLRRFIRGAALLMEVLLIVVLVVGHSVKGASRWISLGFFHLQPTEFAKPFLVFATAHYLARVEEGEMDRRIAYPLVLGITALAVLLIFLQPDLGNTILIVMVLSALWFVHGVNLKYLAVAVFMGTPVVIWALFGTWRFHRRLLPYLFPERFLRPGDQPLRSLEALGSGGLTGMGLGAGPYKMKYLAEAHTDYIGAMVGQELGFLGIALVALAFAAMFVAGVRIALRWRQTDRFRFYLALGLAVLLGFHVLMNLSVITYLFPSKGITLPFISYGGSSLVSSLGIVGMLLYLDGSPGEAQEPEAQVRGGDQLGEAQP